MVLDPSLEVVLDPSLEAVLDPSLEVVLDPSLREGVAVPAGTASSDLTTS